MCKVAPVYTENWILIQRTEEYTEFSENKMYAARIKWTKFKQSTQNLYQCLDKASSVQC